MVKKPKIEQGVPVPDETRGGHSSIPFRSLEVGESIRFPLEIRLNVASYASIEKRRTGKEFTVRKVDDKHARIWRVK